MSADKFPNFYGDAPGMALGATLSKVMKSEGTVIYVSTPDGRVRDSHFEDRFLGLGDFVDECHDLWMGTPEYPGGWMDEQLAFIRDLEAIGMRCRLVPIHSPMEVRIEAHALDPLREVRPIRFWDDRPHWVKLNDRYNRRAGLKSDRRRRS
ncbi:MAG: hypothetical protein KKA05_10360 [Alphaproteobacteria bacterium]|nr:hypothetical protein [Alphaproteobacteria bacterium]